MASTSGVLVDDNVIETLNKSNLSEYLHKFVFSLHVRRLEHLSQLRDNDMIAIGLNAAQIRCLREQRLLVERAMWNKSDPKPVYVQNNGSISTTNDLDERTLIPSEQIKVYEKLGEGSFAVVKRGIWQQNNGRKVDVAIKILRDISPTVLEDLRVEANHLLKLQHPSLIRLYGIVKQPAMMVFELCEGGSLLDRLRDENKSVLLVSVLLDYSIQIAKGLQFLESKHCVHRDVAARNILLSKDEKTIKICDFGLMRALKDNEQMYTMSPQKRVPFAWCPPESLKHRKFSHASDVWSYGVAVWELFTYGEEPWPGCRAIDVLKLIDAGERLEKPIYCSEKIYKILLKCWKTSPEERIKFSTIREDLAEASFLNAVVREPHNSSQKGQLTLGKNDEVIIIENSGYDWFGQNKKNQQFGTFPRTCVFVQSNPASLPTTVTPQKPMPTAAQKIMQEKGHFGNPRISSPIEGSFIHTGHGDALGGHSWGAPNVIDNVYLKNPVKGKPLSRRENGAEMILSKQQIPSGNRSSMQVLPPSLALGLDDLSYEFEMANNDNFSPSEIEYPPEIEMSKGPPIVSDFHPSIDSMVKKKPLQREFIVNKAPSIKNNEPLSKTSHHVHRTELVFPTHNGIGTIEMPINGSSNMHLKSDIALPPTAPPPPPSHHSLNTAKSAGDFITNLEAQLNRNWNKSDFSVSRPDGLGMNRTASASDVTRNQQTTPCLVPTPISYPNRMSQIVGTQVTETTNSLIEELTKKCKENGTSINTSSSPINVQMRDTSIPRPRPTEKISNLPLNPLNVDMSMSRPVSMPPSNGIHRTMSERPQSTTNYSIGTGATIKPPTGNNQQQQKTDRPSTSNGNNLQQKNTIPATNTKRDSFVVHRSQSSIATTCQKDEDRRSKISAEISSLLPPASSLLYSNSTQTKEANVNNNGTLRSFTPTPSSSSAVATSSQPSTSTAIVPKKKSEPALPLDVLKPIPLGTASIVAKSNEAENRSKVTEPPRWLDENRQVKGQPQQQQSQVPLFNITNSAGFYPPMNGFQMQPYYGMNGGMIPNYNIGFHPSLSIPNSNFQTMHSHQLQPNKFVHPTNVKIKPLSESDINELVKQPSSSIAQSRQLNEPSNGRTVNPDETMNNMAEKMEKLYKLASFTQRVNCDEMVSKCHGDTEMALKRLKENHLISLGMARNATIAQQALLSSNYDLDAAAILLLGIH